MTRLDRIKLTTRQLGISRKGDLPSQIFDNLFATTWRLTPEEMEYINDNADDEQLDLLTYCEDFAGKRRAIKLRNLMVYNYNNK